MSFDWSNFMGGGDTLMQPRVVSQQGGAGMNPMGLISSLQQQSQQANTDSLKQYKALLASVANTKSQVMGQFDQMGKGQMQQINQQGQQQMGQATTSAIGRGLGNTNIIDGMQGNVARNTQMEQTNLASNIAGQKANMGMQLGQMQGDAILSKQNQAPNMSMYLQLIQQLASGMGGGTGRM